MLTLMLTIDNLEYEQSLFPDIVRRASKNENIYISRSKFSRSANFTIGIKKHMVNDKLAKCD